MVLVSVITSLAFYFLWVCLAGGESESEEEEVEVDDEGNIGRNGRPKCSEIRRRCCWFSSVSGQAWSFWDVRRSSRIYVHLVVIVRMDWGIRRFAGYVIKSVDIGNGSVMFPLSVIRQNGCILFSILDQFGFRESFLMSSKGSGLLRDTSSPWATSIRKLVVLVKDWGSFGILGLTASGTRTSSSKWEPGTKLLLL